MLYGEPVATVADELLIESLPSEVQAAITRVYGTPPVMQRGGYTAEDMAEAYEAGFDEAAEQMERPYFDRYDFDRWLNSR